MSGLEQLKAELESQPENLMRPEQVEDAEDEKRVLKAQMSNEFIQDKRSVLRRLRDVEQRLSATRPRPLSPHLMDAAVRLERDLREKILEGMPTQAEMRRAPAGAVDKHIAWEQRNKERIIRWKNLRLRMHESDMLGSKDTISNLERYRPYGGSHELNMHNEMIQGRQFYGGTESVVATDDDLEAIAKYAPDLKDKMGLLSPQQREQVLGLVRELTASEGEKKEPKKSGRRAKIEASVVEKLGD